MIIRLLQSFSEITLDSDANPASKPPVEWASGEGRRPEEKIWMKTHLTMYAHVSNRTGPFLFVVELPCRMGAG